MFSRPFDFWKGAQAPRKARQIVLIRKDETPKRWVRKERSRTVKRFLCAIVTQLVMAFAVSAVAAESSAAKEARTAAEMGDAAAQKPAQAQYNLVIYYARFTDNESVRLTIKWLNEAAKQDYADAQFSLAKLYLNPHHPASREQEAGRRAISLLRLAAAQKHSGAKAKLEELGVK